MYRCQKDIHVLGVKRETRIGVIEIYMQIPGFRGHGFTIYIHVYTFPFIIIIHLVCLLNVSRFNSIFAVFAKSNIHARDHYFPLTL